MIIQYYSGAEQPDNYYQSVTLNVIARGALGTRKDEIAMSLSEVSTRSIMFFLAAEILPFPQSKLECSIP